MSAILRVTDGELLVFYSMSFLSRTANYLQTFTKISGWEVLLFSKIDNFDVKAFKNWWNFLTFNFFLIFEFWQ